MCQDRDLVPHSSALRLNQQWLWVLPYQVFLFFMLRWDHFFSQKCHWIYYFLMAYTWMCGIITHLSFLCVMWWFCLLLIWSPRHLFWWQWYLWKWHVLDHSLAFATQQAFWFGLALLVWGWLHLRQGWGRGCFKCSWQQTGLDRRCSKWMVVWIFYHSIFLSQWICVLPLFDVLIVYLHSLYKYFMGCLHPQYHHWAYQESVLTSDII